MQSKGTSPNPSSSHGSLTCPRFSNPAQTRFSFPSSFNFNSPKTSLVLLIYALSLSPSCSLRFLSTKRPFLSLLFSPFCRCRPFPTSVFRMKGGKSKAETASTAKKADSKLGVKRKAAANDRSSKKPAKKEKAGKDPNKPKRPASAFFVFMEEFRKTFKEKNPNNKSVAAVGKAGGDKWKSMSEAEKAPFAAKAAKRKTEYNKNMAAYNKKQADVANEPEEESDKSKSEVNDEDDEDDESGEEEEDDDE